MVDELAELGAEDKLQYDKNEDKSQNAEMFPILDKEPEVTQEGGPIGKHRNIVPKRS